MYAAILFLFSCLLISLPLKGQVVDTLNRDTIPLSMNFEERSSVVDSEEQQRREDNRAEMEAMKRRFRNYYEEEKQKERQKEKEAEREELLWSNEEKEESEPYRDDRSKGLETNLLREDISRHLQRNKSSPTDVPSSDHSPNWTARSVEVGGNDWQQIIKESLSSPGKLSIDGLYKGQQWMIEGLSFVGENQELAPVTNQELQAWVVFLKENPKVRVEVSSYAATNVDTRQGLLQSKLRAQNIATFLMDQGVSPEQVSYKGYGNASSHSIEEQRKNERIEMIILEMP